MKGRLKYLLLVIMLGAILVPAIYKATTGTTQYSLSLSEDKIKYAIGDKFNIKITKNFEEVPKEGYEENTDIESGDLTNSEENTNTEEKLIIKLNKSLAIDKEAFIYQTSGDKYIYNEEKNEVELKSIDKEVELPLEVISFGSESITLTKGELELQKIDITIEEEVKEEPKEDIEEEKNKESNNENEVVKEPSEELKENIMDNSDTEPIEEFKEEPNKYLPENEMEKSLEEKNEKDLKKELEGVSDNLLNPLSQAEIAPFGIKPRAAGDIVNIPDEGLKKTINANLGRGEVISDITEGEMASLTNMIFKTSLISNLEGLQYAVNLKELNLNNRKNIEDLTPIEGLNKLEGLYLMDNNISDIEQLRGLTNLRYLQLGRNKITNLDPIKNLTLITNLTAYNNNIKDLIPITTMVGLKVLNLSTNVLDDTSLSTINLSQLNLESLDISFNSSLGNISGLASLGGINSLSVRYCNLSSINAISNLTSLKALRIDVNKVTSIGNLSKLINLESLDISSNQIYDISAIANFSKLTSLEASYNGFSNLSPIYNLIKLTNLNVGNNRIYTLGAIIKLTELKTLNASINQIEDVSPIAGLTKLTSLRMTNNRISDISSIKTVLGNISSNTLYKNFSGQKIENYDEMSDGNGNFTTDNIVVNGDNNPVIPTTFVPVNASYSSGTNKITWTGINIQSLPSNFIYNFNDTSNNFSGQVISTVENNLLSIPDKNLRKAVNYSLGRGHVTSPELFSRVELESIIEIEYTQLIQNQTGGGKIADLTGLNNMVNLEKLTLTDNTFSDLWEVSGLRSLKTAIMTNNEIEEIGPFSVLTGLEYLDLSKNKIENFYTIITMSNLSHLYIGDNRITEMDMIGNAQSLKTLYISNNFLTNTGSVDEIIGLEKLWINGNQISDISKLKNLDNLNLLDASYNNIVDLKPLETISSLEELYMNSNEIAKVKPLSGLVGLKVLELKWNHILDISSLENVIKSSNMIEFSAKEQEVDWGTGRVNGTVAHLPNPAMTIGSDVAPIVYMSASGVYDQTTKIIEWSNLMQLSQPRSFDFNDTINDFSGHVTLTIKKIKIMDPDDPNSENLNPDPEGLPSVDLSDKLAINYIEPLDFGENGIVSGNMDIKAETMTPYFQVTDLRDENTGWSLRLSGTQLKNNKNSTAIDGASIVFKNGQVSSSPVGNTDSPVFLENGSNNIELPLDNSTQIDVMNAANGKGTGTWLGIWKGVGTTNEKVTLKIPDGKAKVGSYSSVLKWELYDTP